MERENTTKPALGSGVQDTVVPDDVLIHQIYVIRDQKVMLDRDLAALYGVTTGNLNKAVKRKIKRFPKLDIPNWNIKLGRGQKSSICIYRTRRSDAVRSFAQRPGNSSQHPDHAHLHPHPADAE